MLGRLFFTKSALVCGFSFGVISVLLWEFGARAADSEWLFYLWGALNLLVIPFYYALMFVAFIGYYVAEEVYLALPFDVTIPSMFTYLPVLFFVGIPGYIQGVIYLWLIRKCKTLGRSKDSSSDIT